MRRSPGHASGHATGTPAPALGDVCPDIRLLIPDGSPLDLTGTYSGPVSSVFLVKQTRTCVVMEGFSGTVLPDFTVPGRWVWAHAPGLPDAEHGYSDAPLGIVFVYGGPPLLTFPSMVLGVPDPYTITLERTGADTAMPLGSDGL